MRHDDLHRTSLLSPRFGRSDAPIGTRDLAERQSQFAAAILDPKRPVPAGLIGPDGGTSLKRFSVYRNNVVAGLVDALKAAFPAVHRIVGDQFFSAMARVHVSHEPPASPVMLEYGAGFADFIGAFEPAATLPYLGDVARLERAWAEAYHAAEAEPLGPAAFARITPDRLPDISLALHPSVRLVRSRFPTITIWQMNIDGGVPTGVDIEGGGEDALVVRPAAEVEVRLLPVGAAAFRRRACGGVSVVDATQSALADAPRFDLPGTLAGLMEAGAVVGWHLVEKPVHDIQAKQT